MTSESPETPTADPTYGELLENFEKAARKSKFRDQPRGDQILGAARLALLRYVEERTLTAEQARFLVTPFMYYGDDPFVYNEAFQNEAVAKLRSLPSPQEPTPGVEPGTARLRIGGSTTELSRRNSDAILDPKPCPNRAYKENPLTGALVSVDTLALTKSHTRVWRRRPLLSTRVAFRGISRRINDITQRFSVFLRAKVVKSTPETVPQPCLASATFPLSHTNTLSGFRFSEEAQRDLERAVRDELRAFQFRRGA